MAPRPPMTPPAAEGAIPRPTPRPAPRLGRATTFAAALALGALGVFAFAPFEAWPLAFVAWGGLFALLRGGRSSLDAAGAPLNTAPLPPRRAALTGWGFGLGLYVGGVSWVYVSMHDVGGMPAPIAALAALALAAYLALYPALVGIALSKLAGRRPLPPAAAAVAFAALVALSEWLRGWVLTGFPWLALGYSQTPPSPLAGFAPLLGVYGVSGIAALCGALLWNTASSLALRAYPLAIKHSCAFAAALLGGWLLAGISWTQPSGTPIRVALLQGNIPQSLKWEPERLRDSLVTYLALTREHPADLTVLPETALPLLFDQLPADYLAALRRAAPGDLLAGAPTRQPGGYANSALALGPDGQAAQGYHKAHLVPFGEYIPPGFDWFLKLMKIPMGDFYAGPDPQRPLLLAGQKVAVNICYEDLFPDQIARGAQEATVLVNLSNTAWFGHSLAQPQHLQISRMRAVETGRPMLRATNTGMTAHVTPDGRVAGVLAPFTRDGLVATVTGTTGTTPYVRFGNLPALLLAVAALLLATLLALRAGRRAAATSQTTDQGE